MWVTEKQNFRIAYLCPRLNFLKVYTPVIVQQLNSNFKWEPVLIIPSNKCAIFGNKNNTAASINALKDYEIFNKIDVFQMDNERHLLDYLCNSNVKAVVYIVAYLAKEIYDYVLPLSKERGIKWCVVGYSGDELLVLDRDRANSIDKWDLITTVNSLWKKWLLDCIRKENPKKVKYAERILPIGNPELDQINQLKSAFNKEIILKKYKLPNNKKIIFITSAPSYSVSFIYKNIFFNNFISCMMRIPIIKPLFKFYAFWSTTHIKNWDCVRSYSEILKEIRSFADNNNCILVCKRRNKDKIIRKYERKYIDMFFEEGKFYPFLTLELLYVADIYIGFESNCFLEALALGKPAINLISILRKKLNHSNKLGSLIWEKLWLSDNALYKIPGISWILRTLKIDEWKEFRNLMRKDISYFIKNYDWQRREEFLNLFFEGSSFNASSKFLNALEKIL